MKTIVAILLLSTLCMSSDKQVLVDSSIQLTNYNHKPSVKLQHKLKLKRLVKITQDEIKKITFEVCKENILYQKLTHKGQLLFYHISTEHCQLQVNALDAKVISKVSN